MKQVDKILLEQVEKNKTPSVQYLLLNKETIIRQYGYGLADIKTNKPVDDLTTYNAFSVTKTFTALAVLQLAVKKQLDIDHYIKTYLPEFPYTSSITIRQLLTHTAGIPNPVPLNWIHLTSARDSFDRNAFFRHILTKNNKTKNRPNHKFVYSNLAYVLIGQLIEKISGLSYETYVCENIISKMGFDSHDLGFEIAEPLNHATGYQKKLSFTNFILGFFLDKSQFMRKAEGKWKPFNHFYVNGVAYGGLIGKPIAFARYIQELLKPGTQLISDDYRKMLFRENFTDENQPTGMCLSWFKGKLGRHTYFTHAGGGGGYYCEIRIYPEADVGSVIFFNRTGLKDERFLDKVDRIYFENG